MHRAVAYLLVGPTRDEQPAFARFVTPGLVRSLQLVGSANAVLVLSWWAFDPWLFGAHAPTRRAYAVLRLGTALFQGSIALGVSSLRAFRERPLHLAVPLMWANAALIGWFVGQLGGPATPWFHFVYVTSFFSIPAPVKVGPRLGLNLVGAACVIAGYALCNPAYLSEPFFAVGVSYYLWTVLTATVLGQMAFRQTVESFRATEALARFNSTLEAEVSRQTESLAALSSHLDRAREADRAHIARELHDELGQELTALRYAVSLTQKRWERDPAALAPSLANLASLVLRAADTTRGLVRELRPRLLMEMGLGPAIEWLLGRIDTADGLKTRFVCPSPLPELDAELAATAFRVVQEALTNTLRHAEATALTVTLTLGVDSLKLSLEDNGQGFDPDGLRAHAGLGLVGMRERVRAVGGQFQLQSAPGRGTALTVVLPRMTPTEPR